MKYGVIFILVVFTLGCTSPPTTTKTTATSTIIITTTTILVTIPSRVITTTSTTRTTTTLISTEIPSEILENCIGFLIGSPNEINTIKLTGGGWVRPHPGPFSWQNIQPTEGTYDFSQTDIWVKTAQENKIGLVATIWPYADWDQKKCHGNECIVGTSDEFYPREGEEMFGIPSSRCKPCDMQAYIKFIEKMIERYDGDGVEDMPGLIQSIKYWEVDNEPFLEAEHLTFFKGTPEEYLSILKVTYNAIKKSCQDCFVLHAGAANIESNELAKWRVVFQNGGIDYFDSANIHYISFGDKSTMNVKDFKKLVNEFGEKPIWLTEAEIKSVNDLIPLTEGAINAGAQKIFYTSIVIEQKGPPKPGQYTPEYKKMKEKCK